MCSLIYSLVVNKHQSQSFSSRGPNNRVQASCPPPTLAPDCHAVLARYCPATHLLNLPQLVRGLPFINSLTLCMLGNFQPFCHLIFSSSSFFSQKILSGVKIGSVNSFDPDQPQHFVDPGLDPNICRRH